MAYTLSNLLQDMYTALGQLRLGVASGGDPAALADASLAGRHRDDEWQGGALFIVAAGGEAPEGEFAAVAGFDAASGAFSLAAELSAPAAAGQRYGLASAYYPLQTMIELANAGLRGLGDLPLVDESHSTAQSGSSFTATLEWRRRRPLRIDYLAIPGLTALNPWRTLHDWDYVPAAPGEPALILFADALAAGRPLRIWYQAAHPPLRAAGDPLAAALPPELAAAAGVERALRWQHARLGGSDAHLAAQWEQAQRDLAEARRSFPIWRPRRAARLMAAGGC
ncbi:MAG: hypothetical protein KIS85_06210 [Anaerolineales bacterium]|nr:hypothetical protein [Anaerolineales bacterium]